MVCESQWATLPKPGIIIFSQFLNSINDLGNWLQAEDYLDWSTYWSTQKLVLGIIQSCLILGQLIIVFPHKEQVPSFISALRFRL